MKCVICKHGKTSPGFMTAAFSRDGSTIVVNSVPADICDVCGEAYLSQEVSANLLKQVAEAAKAGVQVNVRKYMAA